MKQVDLSLSLSARKGFSGLLRGAAALHRACIHGGAAFELCVDFFPPSSYSMLLGNSCHELACAASPNPQHSHALLNPAAPLLTLIRIEEVSGH